MNFGGYATPERRWIFDINDLDETLRAPSAWDVKRLVASFVLAARAKGFPTRTAAMRRSPAPAAIAGEHARQARFHRVGFPVEEIA
jgi:hypothetical protein